MPRYKDPLIKGELSSFSSERKYLRKDGSAIWVKRTLSLVNDPAGRPLYFIRIVEDITERKQAEESRTALEEQLRQAQKMQAIGTLAGGIAHDFNNIITIILGNVELARQDTGADTSIGVSLAEIYKATARASDLVQQILSFSRRQPVERKPIDLAPLVAESVRLLRATLPARLRLEASCAPDMPFVLADANQVQQAVINLATNAMQATPGNGTITIRLDTAMRDSIPAKALPMLNYLHQAHPDRVVRLAISDTGVGMTPDIMSRIFEPFFTTKPQGEGTGLGLSVVHGIMESHEGAVAVVSRPGEGATFTLYFPEVPAKFTAPAATEPASSRWMPSNAEMEKRILYIDDDESLVFLVERLLSRNGYHVNGYTSTATALAALRENPANFDLVVSDYNMPGASGLDVACEVRAIRPDLPVAVASGFIDAKLVASAEAAGVRELIFKASTSEEYCGAIERLLQNKAP